MKYSRSIVLELSANSAISVESNGYIIFSLIGYHEAVRIVRIRQPLLKKSQSTDITTSWDLPVGSTITVECEKPSQTLTYETHPLAESPRFDSNRWDFIENKNRYKMFDLKPYDTGILACYENNTKTTPTSSLYIFVNDDEDTQLSVPVSPRGYYTYFYGSWFPCLPTSNTTNITLLKRQTKADSLSILTPGVDYIASNEKGVKLLRVIEPSPQYYTCTFSKNQQVQNAEFLLYTVELDKLPAPLFAPVNGKHHYLVGQSLALQCTIQYEDTKHLVYKFPASNCPSDVTDALGCDALRNFSRVTMTPLRRVNFGSDYLTSTLSIQRLQVSDSGQYVCQYMIKEDDQYRKFSYQDILVVESPLISVTGEETTLVGVESDESLTLTAKVESLRRPNIRWSFESEDLQVDGKYNMSVTLLEDVFYEAKLKIRALEFSDRGVYSLTASVGGESITEDFTVKVNTPPILSLLYAYHGHTVPVSPSGQTVYFQPSQVLTISCKSTWGFPQPDITWYWQDCDYQNLCAMNESAWVEIHHTSKSQPNQPYIHSTNPGSENLQLTTLKSGWLKCGGENVVGEAEQTMRAVISDLPEEFSGVGFPVATTKQASQLVENDVIVLPCFVSKLSCTEDKIQIIRSSDEVYTKNSPNILSWEVRDGVYKLSIALNVTLDMDGYKYACRCKGGRQGPIVSLRVQTYRAPSWLKHIKEAVQVDPGQTHTMVCQADGTPLPTISWFKDGQLITATETRLVSKNTQNLTLIRVTSADSGEYWCRAEVSGRSDGYIQSSSTLIVTDNVQLSNTHVTIVAMISIVTFITTLLVSMLVLRKFCRRKYVSHILLLQSKENINPSMPLDEQTDALPYDRKWEFPVQDLTLGMLIGQGAFGKVLKAEARNIEQEKPVSTVAVKTVRDRYDQQQARSLISELKILIHIGQHLNIVNLLGACTKDINKGQLFVIVEYCQFGNLRSYLLKHKDNFLPLHTPAGTTNYHFSTGMC
ncbi:Pvr [Bugula neritina]|uniref:receptor protein-tyrosine kinase n=1 Tax=Bugula neritina TaxID=10212 RepID=A0A7J7IT37_BUGNE|nr:Pvr [Bugula neritina]